ncbi:hypothetical protein FA95DRAFT_1566599 [Auriscalpium vulgare]|uniref:Uncharacterized protein n=1 Tax=Auriscalpium vulgare TaxID=40419 RepID=A0ACB8R8H7_9AGAM|nr:hypothetical protein FA95DRAFT_1566599 [Auriscalpium vulgare]
MIADNNIVDEKEHRYSSSSDMSDSDATLHDYSADPLHYSAEERRHLRSSSSVELSKSGAAPPDCSTADPIGASTSDGDSPVNGLTVATRYENINGIWKLDPLAPTSTTSLLTSVVSATNGQRLRDRVSALSTSAATFSTHYGSINARLAIVGDASTPVRAGVRATTRYRKIEIDLFAKASSKFIDLDVYSRNGRVLVMIPRTYSGIVELGTRHGDVTVLPVLSAVARVVRAQSKEVSILVGDASDAPGASSQLADIMHLYSLRGNVVVGFSGEDEYVEPEGMFAKMKRGSSKKE